MSYYVGVSFGSTILDSKNVDVDTEYYHVDLGIYKNWYGFDFKYDSTQGYYWLYDIGVVEYPSQETMTKQICFNSYFKIYGDISIDQMKLNYNNSKGFSYGIICGGSIDKLEIATIDLVANSNDRYHFPEYDNFSSTNLTIANANVGVVLPVNLLIFYI